MNVTCAFEFKNNVNILVGRTGRAGRQGRAVTFYSYQDMSFVRPIATVISQAGFEVPEYTLNLEKVTKFVFYLQVLKITDF